MAQHIRQLGTIIAQDQEAIRNLYLRHSDSMLKLQQGEWNDSRLQKMVEEHHLLLEDLRANLNSIEEKDKILSEKIGHPLDIFGSCETTVDTSVIGSTGNGHYWKNCPTKFYPNEMKVSLHVKCNIVLLY